MDTWVLIDKIKPDPEQPRKMFDKNHLEGLASSLKIEGMINPIEVDSNLMIITGECRWKAAQILHWEKVPVNINKSAYSEYLRLRHQMAENIHQSGTKESIAMNPIDVAKAYARLLKLKTGKDYVTDTLSFKDLYGHLTELGEEVGVSYRTISQYLELLHEPEFVQKDIAQGRPRTYYNISKYAPKEFRKDIEKRIAKGEFESRPKLLEMVKMAKRTPDLARIQLARTLARNSSSTNRILNGVAKLALALEAMKLKDIHKQEKEIVTGQLVWLKGKIEEYLDI